MTDNKKNFISKLNSIYIVVLGCILGSILIFNSDYVNNQKASTKLNQEKANLFNRIISKRRLEESPEENDEEYIYETDEVCSHASDKLQKYYQTGVLSDIDLDNGSIKCEEKNEEYMQALINIFKSFVDEGNSDNTNGGRRNLRNLLNDDGKENITKYLSSRILPMLVFFGISVLSIIGWIICCFCCCCNCCCCCCCKKPGCKIPCFIFSYIFYALVVACSIYGLTQASKIFVGLADTECSLLQFFDQILYGEKKETKPKWIGIEGVSDLLERLNTEIDGMSKDNLSFYLEQYMSDIDITKNDFMNALKDSRKEFYESNTRNPLDKYCIDFSQENLRTQTDGQLTGKYVLDLIPLFGKYDGNEFKPKTLVSFWNEEITNIDRDAGQVLDDVKTSFNNILVDKIENIKKSITKGQDELSKLRNPFDSVYNDITEVLYDASDYSDKKGKITVNLIFGILGFMNICLAVLMLFICMFSGKACIDCGFCRCIFKFASHILWNVLAILMILSFAIGSIIALVGRVGGDLMSFVSFIVSEENFLANPPVLLNKLGDGKNVLKTCIVGNGDLSTYFGLSDMENNLNNIRQQKVKIDEHIRNFTEIAMKYPAYNQAKKSLENKTEFINDTFIISLIDENKKISLDEIIKSLNDSIGSTSNERWNYITGIEFKCDDTTDGNPESNILHPWKCPPNYRDWINGITSDSSEIKNYAVIATKIIELLKKANGEIVEGKSYYDVINELKDDYKEYLDAFLGALEYFGEVTNDTMDILKVAIGDNGGALDFLNGKFIQTNLKVILKYLKYSLGKDFYTVGLCLLIIGCSLVLSISSTILLIVIINADLENSKKLADNTEIPNYPASNDGRVVEFKY